MTYQEQLLVEKQNKEILNDIIENHADELVEFYKTHNRKETREKFGIRTDKQLVKILKLLKYDFSFEKALNKGKPAARSHESYINGGKKSAETQTNHWSEKSDEEKRAWSDKQKLAHSSDETKEKIRKANKEYYANLTAEQKEEFAKRRIEKSNATWSAHKDEIVQKARETCLKKYGVDNFAKSKEYHEIVESDESLKARAEKNYSTKKTNNSFNISKPEDKYYEYLINKYGKDDIIREYRDSRYPFSCDFYIKSKDLFIELNFTWTHGKHEFDSNNQEDAALLEAWKEKAKTSTYYAGAIESWTIKDPLKIKTAKDNHINYKYYYTEEEAYNDKDV